MKLKQYYVVIAIVFLTVVGISFLWEFHIEDSIDGIFLHTHKADSLEERWEYVYSVAIFTLIALVIPLFYGRKLIIRQEELHEEISKIASEDYLTNLYNRRKINTLIHAEIKRSDRYKKVFSIILIDIDHFKRVNDQFGHLAGDKFLRTFSDLLQQAIRHTDSAGRWGGEEFLVICPETDMDGALAVADKIRQRIEKHKFDNYGKQTASFGVACYTENDSVDTIINRADLALYDAKNKGRNRVAVNC